MNTNQTKKGKIPIVSLGILAMLFATLLEPLLTIYPLAELTSAAGEK